jgi:hypothetical protein
MRFDAAGLGIRAPQRAALDMTDLLPQWPQKSDQEFRLMALRDERAASPLLRRVQRRGGEDVVARGAGFRRQRSKVPQHAMSLHNFTRWME